MKGYTEIIGYIKLKIKEVILIIILQVEEEEIKKFYKYPRATITTRKRILHNFNGRLKHKNTVSILFILAISATS